MRHDAHVTQPTATSPATAPTPGTILQVGTGRFLRAFIGAFAHETPGSPRIVAVETTGSGMAARLTAQGCAYHLVVRGLRDGRRVEEMTRITSMARAIDARDAWEDVIAAACDPDLRAIVSNVTEAGYAPDADPALPPSLASWPAKLLALLLVRDAAGLPPVPVIPCELVERNGERLRARVREEAELRGTDPARIDRIVSATPWGITLIDRIVTASPITLPDGSTDPLAVIAEPFATWYVALPDGHRPPIVHPSVFHVPDVEPYALRKIRILNGAHSALLARCRGTGAVYVREAMELPGIAAWLEALLLEEIVPALGDRIEDGEAFALAVLERFRNPFLDHRFADIEVNHQAKLAIRLVPTVAEHRARFGRDPERLVAILAAEGVTA